MKLARWRTRAGFAVKRAAQASWGFAVVAVVVVLLWRGFFPDLRRPGAGLGAAIAAALLAAALAVRVAGRLRVTERRRTPWREAVGDFELGLMLLAVTYVLLSAVGGTGSAIYPLVYALVSFLVTFHRLAVGLPLALAAIGLEGVAAFAPGAPSVAAAAFPTHAGFIVVFALLNVAFLHAEVARQRREHQKRVEAAVATMNEEAREFRLISPALGADSRVRSRAEEEQKLAQGSIQTIHQQLFHTLDLLRRSLGLHTCALLWLDENDERLKVKELASESAAIVEEPFPARAGVFAAMMKDLRALHVDAPRPAFLPYYAAPVEIASFVGAPVLDGRTPRGFLIGDRVAGACFGVADVELFQAAAAQVVRIVQSERVFQAVERSKHEHERFYRASAALNRALTLTEVYDAALEGARGVCDFDLALLAAYDRRDGSHTIRRAVGVGGEALAGRTFRDPGSVAGMVVKNKLALPSAGDWRDRGDAYVFEPGERLPASASLLVLPLVVKDEVIGTFTVAARRAGAFPQDRREMLGVIANQVAISMQNAKMVRALEEQATTDALTGLANRRVFDERLAVMLKRADRTHAPVSLVATDIDHFKKVNDTYGHQTGDEVLRRVAEVLKACARQIDISARLGGEEFMLVLEATDRTGARQLAERVRQEVGLLQFEHPKGPFRVTLSLGVAVYPGDARGAAELIKRADTALYAAKHGGRNRTVCAGEPDVRSAA